MKCGDGGNSGSRSRSTGGCGRSDRALTTYRAIVDEYLKGHVVRSNEYQTFVRARLKSEPNPFRRMIEMAAMADDPRYKRNLHQRRIPVRVLAEGKKALLKLEEELRKAKDFEEIHKWVETSFRRVPGLGTLVIYDTALRIGTYRKLLPQVVYLHAGALQGAIALGLAGRGCRIRPEELPPEFRSLRPDQIEDCLCIHKGDLEKIRDAKAAGR